MASCRICLDSLNMPACLPCGHVFCSQCILTTVQTVKPMSSMHRCPTCRAWYNVAPVDLKTVPPNLRPFITPNVRRLFIDTIPDAEIDISAATEAQSQRTGPSRSSLPGSRPLLCQGLLEASTSTSSNDSEASEVARLRAENIALRNHCEMWRKRAEMHGQANLQLLKFGRAMRDEASQIARDRNDLEKRCYLLKKMLDGETCHSDEMMKCQQSNHPSATDSPTSLRCVKNMNTPDDPYAPPSHPFPSHQAVPLHLRSRSPKIAEADRPIVPRKEALERPAKRQRREG